MCAAQYPLAGRASSGNACHWRAALIDGGPQQSAPAKRDHWRYLMAAQRRNEGLRNGNGDQQEENSRH
jgi:hypothetical protein